MRAIAVLAVIANHCDPRLLPSGFLGVDAFFVISGYVITLTVIARSERGSAGQFLLEFYQRRVARILPALLAMVAVVAPLVMCFDPRPAAAIQTGAAALLGISNLLLYRSSAEYFNWATALNAFTHTWSLGVEEQFYLLFPVAAWFGLRRAPRMFVAGLGTIVAVSFAGFVWFEAARPMAAFFLLPFRAWELAVGCLLALHSGRNTRIPPKVLANLGLLLVFAAFFAPRGWLVSASLAVVAGTALLLVAGQINQRARPELIAAPVRRIGRVSYSLYLWHWPVLALGRLTVGVSLVTIPLLLAAMFALAASSERWVERPWRSSLGRRDGLRAIVAGVTASMVLAASLVAAWTMLGAQAYAGQRARLSLKGPATLYDTVTAASGGRWEGRDCIVAKHRPSIDAANCTVGIGQPRLLVVGDSDAAAFIRAFAKLAEITRSRVTLIASFGASAAPNVVNATPWRDENEILWNDAFPAVLEGLKPGDSVMLVADLAAYARPGRGSTPEANLSELRIALERLSARLAARGIGLIVMEPLPLAREAECLPDMAHRQWFNPFGVPCRFTPRAEHLARLAPLRAMLGELRAQGTIGSVDLFALFCPAALCTYGTAKHRDLYRDEFGHPSAEVMDDAARAIAMRWPRATSVRDDVAAPAAP